MKFISGLPIVLMLCLAVLCGCDHSSTSNERETDAHSELIGKTVAFSLTIKIDDTLSKTQFPHIVIEIKNEMSEALKFSDIKGEFLGTIRLTQNGKTAKLGTTTIYDHLQASFLPNIRIIEKDKETLYTIDLNGDVVDMMDGKKQWRESFESSCPYDLQVWTYNPLRSNKNKLDMYIKSNILHVNPVAEAQGDSLLTYEFCDGVLAMANSSAIKMELRESGKIIISVYNGKGKQWSIVKEATFEKEEIERLSKIVHDTDLCQMMESVENDITQEMVRTGRAKFSDYDGSYETLKIVQGGKNVQILKHQIVECANTYPNVKSLAAVNNVLKEIARLIDKVAPNALGHGLSKRRGDDTTESNTNR